MDINVIIDKEIRDLISRVKKYHGRFENRKSFFNMFGGDIIKKSMTRKKWNNKGVQIPPFLIASISSDCNLNCSGCYARADGGCVGKNTISEMTAGQWSCIFHEADDLGISFILLAGGEPGMRPDVIREASKHKNIIFPIFTNGTLMSDEDIELYRENGHLIPMISIEGDEEQTDSRRGPEDPGCPHKRTERKVL